MMTAMKENIIQSRAVRDVSDAVVVSNWLTMVIVMINRVRCKENNMVGMKRVRCSDDLDTDIKTTDEIRFEKLR